MSDEIERLRGEIADAEAGQDRLRKRRELVAKLEARVALYRERLASERQDVERLEGPGLAAFVRGLFVDRDRELDREKRELALAVLLHDEARAELAEAREGIAALAEAARDTTSLRSRLEVLLRERAASADGLKPDDARELARIELRRLRKELVEADQAAGSASASLAGVLEKLGSASTLGTLDLIGGGMLISAMKHGRISAARSRLSIAQSRLRVLARELQDLRVDPVAEIELEPLTRFVDVFLDNLFTDWTVQTRIHKSTEQVRDVKRRVDELQLALRQRLRDVEDRLAANDRS